MNKLAKPISSPGRTEKFPPPLMRFLRSNVGNKSRRRSRASPMFVKKKNTIIETTQEPSSPKVTCIGQVRVRRSNKTTAATSLHHYHGNRLCGCLRNLKPKSFCNVWSKCVSFFQHGSCKNETHVSTSPVVGENNGEQEQHREDENGTLEKAGNINEGLRLRPTPKNAFQLTRCRSVPYRSSSLASIFRESIMEKTGEDEVEEKIENLKIKKEDESNGCEESKAGPLILSRCKSEPARTWDQLLLN